MKTHKDLTVWKNAIQFVTDIYKVTATFPRQEIYGITSQIRRASVSIPSNIAEGAARKSVGEYKQFLYISLSSASEVDTQLTISHNLGFITTELEKSLGSELNNISKMIQGLIKSLDR
jgi:four helix bundle protein